MKTNQWGQMPILVTLAGAVGIDDAQHFAFFDLEIDIIEGLEWGALLKRLAGDPPPLVERGGFQALQLAELVFLGDVADFDDGHSVYSPQVMG